MKSVNVAPYRKAIAAAVGGLIVIATAVAEAVADGVFDLSDGLTVAAAIGTVFGVYRATNEPSPAE